MADGNRTENATPRRLFKARQEGNVPRSRELSAALVLMTVVLYLWWGPQNWIAGWHIAPFVRLLETGARGDLYGPHANSHLGHLASLRMGRASPGSNLDGSGGRELWTGRIRDFAGALDSQTGTAESPSRTWKALFAFGAIQGLLKSLIPMSFVLYFGASLLFRECDPCPSDVTYGNQLFLDLHAHAGVRNRGWKAALVFSLWAGFDALLSYFNYGQQHRMTQQEVREDFKETEGHPAIRGRIRRLQRDMRRRRMMRDVSRATVVVTNPTEFAVALEYKPETMAAPVVVAKGRNFDPLRNRLSGRRAGSGYRWWRTYLSLRRSAALRKLASQFLPNCTLQSRKSWPSSIEVRD